MQLMEDANEASALLFFTKTCASKFSLSSEDIGNMPLFQIIKIFLYNAGR